MTTSELVVSSAGVPLQHPDAVAGLIRRFARDEAV
jgi:hypothetical protein